MTHCSLCVCLRYQALFWVWVSTGTHLPRLMLVRSSWPWIHPYVLLYVVKRPQQSFRPLRGESLLSASSILTGREEREQPTARRAFCVNSDLVVTNTVTISACVDRHEDKVIKMRRVQLHFSVRNISLDFFIPKVCNCMSCPPWMCSIFLHSFITQWVVFAYIQTDRDTQTHRFPISRAGTVSSTISQY